MRGFELRFHPRKSNQTFQKNKIRKNLEKKIQDPLLAVVLAAHNPKIYSMDYEFSIVVNE